VFQWANLRLSSTLYIDTGTFLPREPLQPFGS
jgi:hypothetical protein